MNQRADVVIIGGGIVGAACAYYLTAAGMAVHLVERRFPTSGASRACDGLILLWDKATGPELALGQASAALWAELVERLGFDFEYARKGTVMLVEEEAGMSAARTKAEVMGQAGIRAELLENAGLRSLEPHLAPDLAGGVFFPDDAQVDPRRATLAFIEAARRQGLTLTEGAVVTAIRRAPDGEVSGAVTDKGEIATDTVVCAAGAWSAHLAELVELDLPVRPRKGHVLVATKAPGLIHHSLLEGGYVSTVQTAAEGLQVALAAELTASGTLLLGSSREFAGYDRTVSLEVVRAIAGRAGRFLPSIAGKGVIRSYAGLRPWSPDHLPLIGPAPGVPGFYLATGHEGAGICLAPITGQLIAGWITGSTEMPSFATAVRPDRFL